MSRRPVPFILVAAALLLALPAAAAREVEGHIDEIFDVSPGARLELRHGDGDVRVRVWDRDEVRVEVDYRITFRHHGLGSAPDFKVSVEQDGNTVRAVEHSSGGVYFGALTREVHEYRYAISAPAWVELDFLGDDGDVEIEAWRSSIRVRSEDGDVQLTGCEGEIFVDVEDGDLDARGLAGRLEVVSEDGDVRIERCAGPIDLDANVEDGDVVVSGCDGGFELETEDGELQLDGIVNGARLSSEDGGIELRLRGGSLGKVDLRTSDGNVQVELLEAVGAAYDLKSDDGSVRVDAGDGGRSDDEKRHFTGRVGDGAVDLRVRTDEGRIRLLERR